jgi:hypothetical protein
MPQNSAVIHAALIQPARSQMLLCFGGAPAGACESTVVAVI